MISTACIIRTATTYLVNGSTLLSVDIWGDRYNILCGILSVYKGLHWFIVMGENDVTRTSSAHQPWNPTKKITARKEQKRAREREIERERRKHARKHVHTSCIHMYTRADANTHATYRPRSILCKFALRQRREDLLLIQSV